MKLTNIFTSKGLLSVGKQFVSKNDIPKPIFMHVVTAFPWK